MSDVRIVIQDLADPSSYVCPRVRFWFRKHGLDFEDFKKNGIAVEDLYALNDQTEAIRRLERTARRRLGMESE